MNFTSFLMHWGVKRETSIQKAGELAREWCNVSGLHLVAVTIELEELILPKCFLSHFFFFKQRWIWQRVWPALLPLSSKLHTHLGKRTKGFYSERSFSHCLNSSCVFRNNFRAKMKQEECSASCLRCLNKAVFSHIDTHIFAGNINT